MRLKTIATALILWLFSGEILADELLIFHKSGCRPCSELKKMLEKNPDATQGLTVSMIDVTQQPKAAELFNIGSVPTVVRLDSKTREVARRVGYMSKKEMKQWLDSIKSK